MAGHIIRSRIQCLSEYEKPSKYFCSLEHKSYIEKTIKKVQLDNGNIITSQKEILNAITKYYRNLFECKDHLTTDYDLEVMFNDYVNKLNHQESQNLEGPLLLEEIESVLKNMKHNKTPGIDGFSAEFFKVFWNKLKFFILRVLNSSYTKGILPLSLRQCIITCLPKGDKPRERLKNWRPISLLSVVYKLASAAIANRIKKILPKIISSTQTGFITGRYIGESTRLVYDIMNSTEINNIDGLLMLIDFEKAYDSISWAFMFKVLNIFGFGNSLI